MGGAPASQHTENGISSHFIRRPRCAGPPRGMRAAPPGGPPPASVSRGRWLIAGAALLLQFSIGAVYAWSVFASALSRPEAMGLSQAQAALPFTVTIGMIFIGSFLGGLVQDRTGPRAVAVAGGIIYGCGNLLASLAQTAGDLWLLVLGYGVIAGFGLGFAYIVPIAMLQKWFPDKRGLITGLAVAGFGFGAVVTAPLAQQLIALDPARPAWAFVPLGLAYLLLSVGGALFFRNPPAGWVVPGWDASAGPRQARAFTPPQALRTPQWYLLTAILTLNVTVGIALIAGVNGSAQDMAGYSAGASATLVGILALFNGGGRIFWAWVSDRTGRMVAFALMLGLQGACLLVLAHTSHPALFFILAAVVYLCYGGAFGTLPATAGDFFGMDHAGAIYGLMLVGWSLGGLAGPPLIAALIGAGKNYALGYTVMGGIAILALVLPALTRAPDAPRAATRRTAS